MSKKLNSNDVSNEKFSNESAPKVDNHIACDIYEGGFNRGIPKIRTFDTSNGPNLALGVYENHRKFFKIIISPDDQLSLRHAVKELNENMNKYKLLKIQWPTNDLLLKFDGDENILNECKQYLIGKQLILCNEAREIFDETEKLDLLKRYHEDKLVGGHCGGKKLYAKLRSKYFWKNMPYDCSKFVKNCKQCMLK